MSSRLLENGNRSWASPVTAVAFITLSITGIFMLFHVRIPGFHVLHEMMGIVFCLMGVYHLMLNWRPLVKYCSSRAGMVAIAVTAILSILLFIGGANHEQEEGWHRGRGPYAIESE